MRACATFIAARRVRGAVIAGLLIHAAAHAGANVLVAALASAWVARGVPAWREVWPRLWPMLAANAMDVDHLLADPVYDPGRCSLGFHPLHTAPATLLYVVGAFWARVRWFAVGALTHLVVDGVDCLFMH